MKTTAGHLLASVPCLNEAMSQDPHTTTALLCMLADSGWTPGDLAAFDSAWGHALSSLNLANQFLLMLDLAAHLTRAGLPAPDTLAWLRYWIVVDENGNLHDRAVHFAEVGWFADDFAFGAFDVEAACRADTRKVARYRRATGGDNEAAILADKTGLEALETEDYVAAAGGAALTGVLAKTAGLSLDEVADFRAAGSLDMDGLRTLIALRKEG